MSNITEIRYVAYGVPDFEGERTFYREQWGLREVKVDAETAYFAADGGEELYVVRLRKSPIKRIDVISLAARDREAVNGLHERVKASGSQVIHAPQNLQSFGGGYGFRFFSPDGLSFEISSDVERGQIHPVQRGSGMPEKISHIVLHSAPKHKELTQFFVDVLGFQLSDWIGEFMSFLRCNEWHHRIAILPGPPALNHVAYDMPNVDEMLRGIGKLKRMGTPYSGVPVGTLPATILSVIFVHRTDSPSNTPRNWKRLAPIGHLPCMNRRPLSWINGASAPAAHKRCRNQSPIMAYSKPLSDKKKGQQHGIV